MIDIQTVACFNTRSPILHLSVQDSIFHFPTGSLNVSISTHFCCEEKVLINLMVFINSNITVNLT